MTLYHATAWHAQTPFGRDVIYMHCLPKQVWAGHAGLGRPHKFGQTMQLIRRFPPFVIHDLPPDFFIPFVFKESVDDDLKYSYFDMLKMLSFSQVKMALCVFRIDAIQID